MKTIELTQGQIAIVDDDDFDALNAFKWCAQWNPGTRSYYAKRIALIGGGRTKVYMHRAIPCVQQGFDVDHINRNTLDNQRANLRICSRSENMRNRGKTSANTSGFKGVSWHKQHGKWLAKIELNGKQRHLGYFDNVLEAAAAYDQACIEMHGAFARHNNQEIV